MEESVVPYDDEVIAGSENEDENENMGGFAPGPTDGLGLRHSSPFSAFPPTIQYNKTNTHSSISNFTAGPSAIADYSSRIDSSDRERGKGKDTDLDTSIASIAGTFAKFDDITSSIADRAKTRQRPKNNAASTSLDVIELTTEEEDEISLKPSKPKPKQKPKLKIKLIPKEREQPAETPIASIQANPPQAPPAAAAPPRPRPRPRPRVKRAVPEIEAPAPFPPTSTPPSELPIATSPSRPAHPMTSQLPPSDPPMPSLGTAYNDDPNTRAPPIDVLFDGPLSSPNSLFSDGGTKSKKRKRNPPGSDREIDQLASSQDPPRRLFPTHAMYDSSPHGMPPPPTFFAGSSSSSIGRERRAELDTFAPAPPPEIDVVDLTMLPPTLVPAPKPKPKKAKKKTDLSMFDENFDKNAMIVLDEDNLDDDFDPREEGSSKKKTKAKPKEKPAKSKSKAKPPLGGTEPAGKGKVVEVLLNPRPPSKGKGKAKAEDGTPASKPSDKGKKKTKESATNKEIFKSREFVEDSDDELDTVPRGGRAEGAATGSANTPNSVASVTVNAKLKVTPPAPLSKSATPAVSKPKEHSPHRSLSPLSDLDFEMDSAGPSTTKRPAAAGAKKRKSVIDSDAEDDDFAMAADEVIRVNPTPKASTKKRKTETPVVKKGKSDGQKKGRNVVLSDDEEDHQEVEEEPVKKKVAAKPPKASAKQSKKVIHDDEDEEAGADAQNVEKQESTPEEINENVVPATSRPSVAPTPRPSNIPKPSIPSTNSEHKTPIYAKYEIAPRKSSLPMSELIRRANSMPGSPFPATPSAIGPSRLKGLTATARTPLTYSPLLKSSRSMLSRIAPLHPNRRTPPPPPPPPPPRKKTKKELELEEKWEEEMVESVGGMEAWAVLGDEERRDIRKRKWAMELGGWDE